MNIVAKIYFYSMWFVGTPVMIIFIIIYAFIGYGKFLNGPWIGPNISQGTMAEWYGDEEVYPLWTSVIG